MLISMVARAFVISILIATTCISFQWMLGDFYGERIALSIEQWGKDRSSPSESVLTDHLEFSKQSIKWSPSNPRYKELRARLLIMQAAYLSGNQEVFSSLEQMLDLHREAIQERPQWPFSWANLVVVKGLKQEVDDEYRQALYNAMSYGPYEAGAIQRIARSTANNWDLMDAEEENLIYRAIANGVQIDSRLARNLKKY